MLFAVGIYLLIFAGSLAAFFGLAIALPSDYFSGSLPSRRSRGPMIRWLAFIGRNLLGLAIITLGILLSLPGIPGQGLLTIVIGLALVDFPGKHRLVQRFVRRPSVLRSLNRIRGWFGRKPLMA